MPRPRRDGWTAERRRRFLQTLTLAGSVAAACRSVRLSVASAYKLRDRDADFARDWRWARIDRLQAERDALLPLFRNGLRGRPVIHRGRVVAFHRAFPAWLDRAVLAHLARWERFQRRERAWARRQARRRRRPDLLARLRALFARLAPDRSDLAPRLAALEARLRRPPRPQRLERLHPPPRRARQRPWLRAPMRRPRPRALSAAGSRSGRDPARRRWSGTARAARPHIP